MNFSREIGRDDHGRRIDRILRKAFRDMPLSLIHRLLRKNQVFINGKAVKPEYRAKEGDILAIMGNIEVSPARESPPAAPFPAAQRKSLTVLYEGAGLLFVQKARGIAVHGDRSLESLVNSYLRGQLEASLSFKPGPLHRLDKPTSGIIAFSTSLEGAQRFSRALQSGTVKKYYLALMDGYIEGMERWEDRLIRDSAEKKTREAPEDAGKIARMTVLPLASTQTHTLVCAELETGRTHQIRAQGAIHRHPLSGDKKYGASFLEGGFFLHAWALKVPGDMVPGLPSFMPAPLFPEAETLLISLFGDKIIKKLSETLPSVSTYGIL